MRFLLVALIMLPLAARDPLAQRIARLDPTKYRTSQRAHGGAGPISYMEMFGRDSLNSNLIFLHRGVIQPKGGIGHHFHNQMEEMFVILDGEAEFTIDGRTALLKGPAGAPCRMGHSHGIYNPTDRPVEWMNIAVGSVKAKYDAFDLGDDRVGAPVEPRPPFMTLRLDKTLLRDAPSINGGQGTAKYRRALAPEVFIGPWAYVDHLVLPAGATQGKKRHSGVEEFYYVLNGEGVANIGTESAPIKKGDAVPVLFDEVHSFENKGTTDLEFMIVGIARVKMVIDSQDVR